MMSSGKRKRDDYAPHVTSSGQMPQQDGSGDVMIEFLLPEVLDISRTLTCTIVSCIISIPFPRLFFHLLLFCYISSYLNYSILDNHLFL